MSIYVFFSNSRLINCISFIVVVLIAMKGDVNYFCDVTDEVLF